MVAELENAARKNKNYKNKNRSKLVIKAACSWQQRRSWVTARGDGAEASCEHVENEDSDWSVVFSLNKVVNEVQRMEDRKCGV